MTDSASLYTLLADIAATVPDVPADSIISRTVYEDPHLKAVMFGFAPGQSLSEHTASMPAIIHLLRGEATITLGSDTHSAQPGTWIHMEANLPHSVLAHTPVTMLLLLLRA